MTPIIGGVFAAGGFSNNLNSEVAGTTSPSFSQWLHLAPDPLGRPYNCLRAYISQTDYYVPGGQNKYRSEIAGKFQNLSWNQTYIYHWRMVVPRDWINLGASSYLVVFQMHDVNGGSVGRRPTFAGEIANGVLNLVFSRDSVTGGETVYSTPVTAGQEFEITIRVRWADGTNAADSDGFVEIFNGDALVYAGSGRNTWAGTSITEPNPPYIKAGVYQPGPGSSWWDGKAATIFYPAAFVVADGYTPLQCRQWVDGQLAAYGNSPVSLVP